MCWCTGKTFFGLWFVACTDFTSTSLPPVRCNMLADRENHLSVIIHCQALMAVHTMTHELHPLSIKRVWFRNNVLL